MENDRRRLLLAAGALAGATLAGCSRDAPEAAATAAPGPLKWRMVTSWPAEFPGLATAARRLAERIDAASGGRLQVEVLPGGALGGPFEVFDTVSTGKAELGHSAAYFWRARAAAAPFFAAVPFGLTALEMNAWLHGGGGLALWRELYAPFDLVPFPAGNTGMQMAGWFRREITSPADLRGLKMRIPGLGAEVMARVGATPVSLPGAEVYAALQSGALDAAEWAGPYNDLAYGLHRVAKYCYYPGWQEPGSMLECLVHRPAWEALPADLQAVVESCCAAVHDETLADYTAQNLRALATLRDAHGVEFRRLPDRVLAALRRASDAVLDDLAAGDAFARRVLVSMREFRAGVRAWQAVGEVPYYQAQG
jgi:TRAP-type mannitol/chloroaromatic compound transport system substrate-binding protein